jgi:hypothetical protein
MNGDGYADLLVGAPGAAVSGDPDAGKLYVFQGGPHGIAPDATPIELDGRDHTGNTGLYVEFGWSAASAGDVNGDGYADLIGGSAYATVNGIAGTGKAYLYYGDIDGIALTAAPVELDGRDSGSEFGMCVQ